LLVAKIVTMEKHPLLEWMEKNGKSQATVAFLCDCSTSHLSLVLAGKRGASLPLALKLSRATGGYVPVDAFLREDAPQ